MHNEIINLWTIQHPEFDITSGIVEHEKSEYYLPLSGVKEAYHELWQRLNIPEGQILWCYTTKDDIVKTGEEKILWELQIPREKVICFLDDLVWNRILGTIQDISLRSMHNQWFEEWKKVPNNPITWEDYIERCEEEFRAQKPKTGSWWDELFVQHIGEYTCAIIHHPVEDNFVKGKHKWCCR
jgi:hypothetical protein